MDINEIIAVVGPKCERVLFAPYLDTRPSPVLDSSTNIPLASSLPAKWTLCVSVSLAPRALRWPYEASVLPRPYPTPPSTHNHPWYPSPMLRRNGRSSVTRIRSLLLCSWKNSRKKTGRSFHCRRRKPVRVQWCGRWNSRLNFFRFRIVYYVAFGPHGPRTPYNPPGTVMKVIVGTLALIGITGIVHQLIQSQGKLPLWRLPIPATHFGFNCLFFLAQPPPRTITREWQEASNELAIKQKADPISGNDIHLIRTISQNLFTRFFLRYCFRGIQGQGLRYWSQISLILRDNQWCPRR